MVRGLTATGTVRRFSVFAEAFTDDNRVAYRSPNPLSEAPPGLAYRVVPIGGDHEAELGKCIADLRRKFPALADAPVERLP